MKFDNQLRYASTIIADYNGHQPLHTWLKEFFRDHPQMGSHDRKTVSNLVYGFYRLGHAQKKAAVGERILAGLFLCNDTSSELLEYFRPGWNQRIELPLDEKISFYSNDPAGTDFRVTDIFPWKEELSGSIDHDLFCRSFLRQPDLFLRVRPGYETMVRNRLEPLGLKPYEFIPPATLRLPNRFKVEEFFIADKEVVIQDYSSQRVAPFLQTSPQSFWDACAGSGGKSIMAHDLYPDLKITVSDIRESILLNLRQRFLRAGVGEYRSFVVDLRLPPLSNTVLPHQLILVDAPCSGSGTWGRTPEDLYFFDPEKILYYSNIQKEMLSHLAPRLAPNSWLVYCTCSVFKKENEDQASPLSTKFGLVPNGLENIMGFEKRADSLFVARFQAP